MYKLVRKGNDLNVVNKLTMSKVVKVGSIDKSEVGEVIYINKEKLIEYSVSGLEFSRGLKKSLWFINEIK